MNVTMKEVKPGTYVIPAIDNRQRKGYAMFSVAKYHNVKTATLITLTGETKKVTFETLGWRIS